MGNRKKLVLASLVSVMMMLSFAIGLVPSQFSGPPTSAKAAQGATAVAISADGVTPVGDKFSIPVGGEQSFTALSVTDGAATHLIPTGEADWSLATDGAAALTAVKGDFVATVSALAPGEAGLYVSTGDGLTDLVNLTLYNLKSAKNGYGVLDSVTITHPKGNATLLYQTGTTNIPWTLTAETNNPVNTSSVKYSDETNTELGTATEPPYAVTIPDVTALAPSATITALASSVVKYNSVSDSVTLTLQAVNADTNGDGLPDSPFGLNLDLGEEWVSVVSVGGEHRYVHVAGLGSGSSKAIDIPSAGVTVTIADPADATRVVTVTVPAGLLTAGQKGLLVVEAANTITALLGATQAANVKPEPAGGLVAGGQYVEVGILVSSDNGATFSEISSAQLEDHPVTVEMFLSGVLSADDNVRFFAYPTNVTNGSPIAVTANASGAWAQSANGTQVEAGKLTTELTALSMLAPYATPSALRIVSINNTGVDPNTTGAKDYSIGGGTLAIELVNKPTNVVVTIDGNVAAQQTKIASNIISVTVPAANTLSAPATSAKVNVRVEDAADATSFDVSPRGLTYVGPIVTGVTPSTGTEAGGVGVQVNGNGFSANPTVAFGGAALTAAAASNSTLITGTTSAHTPGLVDVAVTLTNKFTGTLAGGFSFTPEDPVLTSVFPTKAYNDGGYTVIASGSHFVDPNTVFKANAVTKGFFTKTVDVAAPDSDNQAAGVQFLDDSRIELVTPAVSTVGMYNVYVATELYFAKGQQLSNLKPFEFMDAATATMHITSVVPNSGSVNGGNSVAIVGDGFPVSGAGGDITTGNVIRVGTKFATNGSIVEVPVTLFRGADVTNSPSSITMTFTFDTTVLTPRAGTNADPIFARDTLLSTWYDKGAQASTPASGQIKVVIASVNTNEITTFDDQRLGGTPTQQTNPFPLGTLRFNVVGADGATTKIRVASVSMADSAAVGLTDAKGQDGFFNVGTSAATLPPADVYFGANKAVLDTAKATQTSTHLYVLAPQGESARAPYKVDVRVQDPNDDTLFAVSRANEAYATGGGYQYKPGPAISSVTPNAAWAFGGTVAHIQGAQFEYTAKALTQVYFGSVLADYAPAPYVNTATDLYVIVPELPSPAATLSPATVTVDVTIKNSTNETVVKSDAFTYSLFNKATETSGETSGDVYTTGFSFTTATGTGATGQKVSLSDDATTAATFIVPAAAATKVTSAKTFALVRATKTPELFGVQNLPGTAIPNVWNFDVHLYSGTYPFTEQNVSYTSAQTPITLRYPTDDTTLPLATNSATLSTYSHDSSFAYHFPTGSFDVDTTTARYQSNVLPSEETVASGNIREVSTRLYHLSALALRSGAKPPVIDCALDGGSREVTANDLITLSGNGLGWIRGIEVLTDSDVTAKSVADVAAGSITSDEYHVSFRFPSYTANAAGPAQLKITINDGTPNGTVKFVNGLTVKATTVNNNDWLKILFGLLAALLGLAAGGNHGGGGGGPCFIATAAYGTPMANQIDTLRDFRDVYLLSNSVGSAFVDVYYHVSPAVADVVAKSPVLAAVVRMVLVPVILLAKLALAMPVTTMALTLLSGMAMYLRRAKKAAKAE